MNNKKDFYEHIIFLLNDLKFNKIESKYFKKLQSEQIDNIIYLLNKDLE